MIDNAFSSCVAHTSVPAASSGTGYILPPSSYHLRATVTSLSDDIGGSTCRLRYQTTGPAGAGMRSTTEQTLVVAGRTSEVQAERPVAEASWRSLTPLPCQSTIRRMVDQLGDITRMGGLTPLVSSLLRGEVPPKAG